MYRKSTTDSKNIKNCQCSKQIIGKRDPCTPRFHDQPNPLTQGRMTHKHNHAWRGDCGKNISWAIQPLEICHLNNRDDQSNGHQRQFLVPSRLVLINKNGGPASKLRSVKLLQNFSGWTSAAPSGCLVKWTFKHLLTYSSYNVYTWQTSSKLQTIVNCCESWVTC